MDCFYAQCEELRRPELRGKPLGVQQKMLVITSNYAARAHGIQKGDSLRVVKEKCPQITICNGEDLSYYKEVSQHVFDLASRWTPKVEKLGLDEIFVDLTDRVNERLAEYDAGAGDGTSPETFVTYPARQPDACDVGLLDWHRAGAEGGEGRCRARLVVAATLAAELRRAILLEVGLTCSAGVSVSKLLAKLVASWRKPDMQTVFLPTPKALSELLPDALPVQRIPGIGFAFTQRCNELGIATIGDYAAVCELPQASSQRSALCKAFDDKAVARLRALCAGVDDSEVKGSGPPKTCSVEDSFWQGPLRTDAQVLASLGALARKLLAKLRVDEQRFGVRAVPTMAVTLRHAAPPGQAEGTRRERERRQVHLDDRLRIAGQGTVEPGKVAARVAEYAFDVFRKLVPQEPFAINILNLQLRFGEAIPASQRTLSFAPRRPDPAAGSDPEVMPALSRPPSPAAAPAEPMAAALVCESSGEEGEASSGTRGGASVISALHGASRMLPQLLAMGFSEAEARAAIASGSDLQAAVDQILEARARPETSCGAGLAKRQKVAASDDQGAVVID